jgi:hypothetical protein
MAFQEFVDSRKIVTIPEYFTSLAKVGNRCRDSSGVESQQSTSLRLTVKQFCLGGGWPRVLLKHTPRYSGYENGRKKLERRGDCHTMPENVILVACL